MQERCTKAVGKIGWKHGKMDHSWSWPQHSVYPPSCIAGEMTKCSSALVMINKSYFIKSIDHHDQHPHLIPAPFLYKVRGISMDMLLYTATLNDMRCISASLAQRCYLVAKT